MSREGHIKTSQPTADTDQRGGSSFLGRETPEMSTDVKNSHTPSRAVLVSRLRSHACSRDPVLNVSVTAPSVGPPEATWLDFATEERSAEIIDID